MKKLLIVLMILSCLVLLTGLVSAQKRITGKIVAVNANQGSILLQNKLGITEYKLSIAPLVKLNNKRVSIEALRPIKNNIFQHAKLELNKQGKITSIIAVYKVMPIQITRVKGNKVLVKNLNTKQKYTYYPTKETKVIRNNHLVNISEVKKGDQGLVVLGLNNKLQQIVVHHYEVSGLIENINYQQKEVTVNVGTRLNPKLKTFDLSEKTKITNPQGTIQFNDLKINNWVKINLNQNFKLVVARNI